VLNTFPYPREKKKHIPLSFLSKQANFRQPAIFFYIVEVYLP